MPALQVRVKVPGQTVIPIPPACGQCQVMKPHVVLDVTEGPRKIWSGEEMPTNRTVTMQGHPVNISGTVQGNQLVLTVTNPPTGLPPLGN
jgi:hypothetical protein